MICQKCNREIEESKFCPFCGEKQKTIKKKGRSPLFYIVIATFVLLIVGVIITVMVDNKKERQKVETVNIYQLMNGGKDTWKSAEAKTIIFQKDGSSSESTITFNEVDIEDMYRKISYDTHGNVIGYVLSFEDLDEPIEKEIKFDLYEGGMIVIMHSDSNGRTQETKGKYVYEYDSDGKIISAEVYELNDTEQYAGCIDLVYDDKENVIYTITYGEDGDRVEERWIDYDDHGRKKKYTVNNQYGVAQLNHIQTITEYYYEED